MGERVEGERPGKGDQMRKRWIVIFVAAAGVMTLGAQSAAAATDQCVAANGAVRMQKGTATCTADGTGSVARVKGANSTASAIGGDHNKATAIGANSVAQVADGSNNTATVSGDNSTAVSGGGDNNTATVS